MKRLEIARLLAPAVACLALVTVSGCAGSRATRAAVHPSTERSLSAAPVSAAAVGADPAPGHAKPRRTAAPSHAPVAAAARQAQAVVPVTQQAYVAPVNAAPVYSAPVAPAPATPWWRTSKPHGPPPGSTWHSTPMPANTCPCTPIAPAPTSAVPYSPSPAG
jgi:hypothetical protein